MVLEILLWLCVILACLVVPLIALPVRVSVSLQSDPTNRMTVLMRPIGGVFPAIPVFDSARKAPRKQRRKRPSDKRTSGRNGRPFRGNLLQDFPSVLGRMIRAIDFEFLRVDADFGLPDPADTGQLFGQLTPLVYGSFGQFNLRPHFGGACLRGSAKMQFRVIPITFFWPMVGFFWRLLGPFK